MPRNKKHVGIHYYKWFASSPFHIYLFSFMLQIRQYFQAEYKVDYIVMQIRKVTEMGY